MSDPIRLRYRCPPPKPYWRPPEHLGDVAALDPHARPGWLYAVAAGLGGAIMAGRIVRDKVTAFWRA